MWRTFTGLLGFIMSSTFATNVTLSCQQKDLQVGVLSIFILYSRYLKAALLLCLFDWLGGTFKKYAQFLS